MNEIDVIAILNIAKERDVLFYVQAVPTDMRNLVCGGNHTLHGDNTATEYAKTHVRAEFLTGFKEKLRKRKSISICEDTGHSIPVEGSC